MKDDADPRVIEALAARILSRSVDFSVERVAEGVSTSVYRIRRGGETFYLRVLPEAGASFAPEARVHTLLRKRGVSVPDVLYVDHCDDALQRSVMLTTEIKGRHIGHCSTETDSWSILAAAGRDLAVVNSVAVEGFGWVKRDSTAVSRLAAEHTTYRAFVLEYLDDDLALLGQGALTRPEIAAIRAIVARFDSWLDVEQGRLAHGDFDATHIYQQDGRYTGIIDFGEIRGADALYDLGHFTMHDGETLPGRVLPYLLDGYREVAALPDDAERRINFTSLLIAVRTAARMLRKSPRSAYARWCVAAIRRAIADVQA